MSPESEVDDDDDDDDHDDDDDDSNRTTPNLDNQYVLYIHTKYLYVFIFPSCLHVLLSGSSIRDCWCN